MTMFAMILTGDEASINQFLEELQDVIPYKRYWKKILGRNTTLKINTKNDAGQIQIVQFAEQWVPRVQTGVTQCD